MRKQVPFNKQHFILGKSSSNGTDYFIILAPLSEDQEKDIIKDEKVLCDGYIIDNSNIYCSGEIDLKNQDEKDFIRELDINMTKKIIPSGYRYEDHSYEHKDFVGVCHKEITDRFELFKYALGCLNKPDRVIIYRVPTVIYKNVHIKEAV